MKISFCIICYDRDAHLAGHLLSELQKQTQYPDEIILVASGMESLDIEAKNLKVFTFKDRMLPNKARNKAADLATGDIIVLSDVDDTPHPQKLEVLEAIFQYDMVDAVVHNYSFNDTNFEDIDRLVNLEKITEVDPFSTNVVCPSQLPIHHAHISARKAVFADIKGPEHMNFGEDGMFCQRIVGSKYNLFYTKYKLISYSC